MERRFAARRDQLLADAEVDPRLLRGVLPRLERFLDPFVDSLQRSEQRPAARHYVAGLLSDLEYKNVESIAYLHDQERQAAAEVHRPVALGPPAPARRAGPPGRARAGRARRRAGVRPVGLPQEGDRVGRGAAAVVRPARQDRQLPGRRLPRLRRPHASTPWSMSACTCPRSGPSDKQRRQKAGVPAEVRFRTRHELALEMLDERGPLLPHAWVSGDDEMGRCSWFRQELRARGECYLLAVPSNTSVRDLAAPDPPYRGPRAVGRACPSRGWIAGAPPCRRRRGRRSRSATGEKGPVVVQAVWTLVQARTEGRASDVAELLVVFRERQGGRHVEARLPAVERAAGHAAGGVRPGVQGRAPGRGVPEAGQGGGGAGRLPGADLGGVAPPPGAVADRDVVPDAGNRRGKKMDAGVDGAAGAEADRGGVGAAVGYGSVRSTMRRTASRRLRRIEEARFYRWKALNRLPPLRVGQRE